MFRLFNIQALVKNLFAGHRHYNEDANLHISLAYSKSTHTLIQTRSCFNEASYQGFHLPQPRWTLTEIVEDSTKSVSLIFFFFFFRFSETIMFLHQIFYQGLKARIASWPTLVLGKKHLFYFHCLFYKAVVKTPQKKPLVSLLPRSLSS